MARRNFDREHSRQHIARYGSETTHGLLAGLSSLLPDKARPRPLSKQELREQAAAALANYDGVVTRLSSRHD
jgi:hypothetical protein